MSDNFIERVIQLHYILMYITMQTVFYSNYTHQKAISLNGELSEDVTELYSMISEIRNTRKKSQILQD